MPRTHGYSEKGKRCYGIHDWGARGRTNAIGALIGKALLTVVLLTGSVNAQISHVGCNKICYQNYRQRE